MTVLWPPQSLPSGPHLLRVKLPTKPHQREPLTAQSAEALIETLYLRHQWHILKRRFRIRGSEVDLAVLNPERSAGRIVEVKLRNGPISVDFTSSQCLLPPRKLAALRRGALALADLARQQGLSVDWSLDLVLVTPQDSLDTYLVHTWPNAVELGS